MNYIVIGLAYGDEGKGTIVDYLVRKHNVDLVVRFNGGCQAGHTVVTPDGRHHTFAQFGSGTFVPGCRTFLSKYMVFNPISLETEEKKLRTVGVTDAFERLYVDENALVATPYHAAMNRIRELLRSNRHGSCGMGIGEVVQDSLEYKNVIRVNDLRWSFSSRKLDHLRKLKLAQALMLIGDKQITDKIESELSVLSDVSTIGMIREWYERVLQRINVVPSSWLDKELTKNVVFEGAQGVLLDQDYGFHPYITWSNCTFDNALTLIGSRPVTRIGVCRPYMTRHGAGPFVTEDSSLNHLADGDHNVYGDWQGNFRIGYFDTEAIRYAIRMVGGCDGIAMTHVDQFDPGRRVCYGYESIVLFNRDRFDRRSLSDRERETTSLFHTKPKYTTGIIDVWEFVRRHLDTNLLIASYGPTANEKVNA